MSEYIRSEESEWQALPAEKAIVFQNENQSAFFALQMFMYFWCSMVS